MSFKDRINQFFSLDEDTEDYYEEVYEPKISKKTDYQEEYIQNNSEKVIALNQQNNRADIKVIEPRVYAEATQIADLLLKGIIVVANFEKAEDDQAQKMIDFIGGTIYAIHGDMEKIGEGMFICAPTNIGLDGLAESFSELRR